MMLWTWRNWTSGMIKTLSNPPLQDLVGKEGRFRQQTRTAMVFESANVQEMDFCTSRASSEFENTASLDSQPRHDITKSSTRLPWSVCAKFLAVSKCQKDKPRHPQVYLDLLQLPLAANRLLADSRRTYTFGCAFQLVNE